MSEQVTARLEAVAARLERVASKLGGGGGGDDDDDDVPFYVNDYENILNKEVKAVVEACKTLGIEKCGNLLTQAYQNSLSLVKRVPNSKKPTNQELQTFLKPGIDSITQADNIRYKGENLKKYGDHYKAIYETIMVISWVTMAPPMGLPYQHVESQGQSADFHLNRVLKNNKSVETKDFIKKVKALNKKVQDYVKEYFKSGGLTWNPKGGSLSDAKEASSGGSAERKEESKEAQAKKKKGGGKKGGGGGMNAVFGSLNKGTAITKGMKKVTKDMKTKNRKDRSGKVNAPKGPKIKRRKKYGPPQTKFMGGRWMVENYELEAGLIEVDKANVKSNVFVTMCDGCTVQIKNKVKAVTIDNCVKVRVFVADVVSTVEIVNCKSVYVIVQEGARVPSFAVDKCESPTIILSRTAFEANPDVYSSNVSAMNVEVPGKKDTDDSKQFPVPEQFLTKIDPKTYKCITAPTEH